MTDIGPLCEHPYFKTKTVQLTVTFSQLATLTKVLLMTMEATDRELFGACHNCWEDLKKFNLENIAIAKPVMEGFAKEYPEAAKEIMEQMAKVAIVKEELRNFEEGDGSHD